MMAATARRWPRANTRTSFTRPPASVPSTNTSLPPASAIAARSAAAAASVKRSLAGVIEIALIRFGAVDARGRLFDPEPDPEPEPESTGSDSLRQMESISFGFGVGVGIGIGRDANTTYARYARDQAAGFHPRAAQCNGRAWVRRT